MTSPTDAQIAELRRLAEAATPGPWHDGAAGNFRVYGPDGRDVHSGPIAEVAHRRDPTTRRSNAAYIAAANPQAVLALLDDLQAVRGDLKFCLETMRQQFDPEHCAQSVLHAMARCVAALPQAAEERGE